MRRARANADMHDDVKVFVELAAQAFAMGEPIVEIGSFQAPGQEGYANLRSLFPGKSYVGCDVVSGPGVDRIEDIHRLTFGDASVGSLIVVETLEHVANPFVAVRELYRVLQDGGVLIASMPFNLPIHHMPDYVRFTPEGMAQLLSVFETTAVFFEGDAKQPFAVYGMALKGGNEACRLAFEAAAARLQNQWCLSEFRDPLLRFEPLDSVVRCDRPGAPLAPIAAGHRVEQRFICAQDGLVRVDVRFTPTGPPTGGWLTFRLCGEDGAELAVVETRAGYVWYERWVAFTFPPVEQSAGRRLSFCLACSDPHSMIAPLTGIATEEIPGAEIVVDGQSRAGSLCFEAFRQRPAQQGSSVAIARGAASPMPEPAPIPAAVAAARLQANEVRYVATHMHEAIEKLRAEMTTRLDLIGQELLASHLRQQAQGEQLVGMDLRQAAQSEQLVGLELRQAGQAEQLVRMEGTIDRLAAAIDGVAAFIGALRQRWFVRVLRRLAGNNRSVEARSAEKGPDVPS